MRRGGRLTPFDTPIYFIVHARYDTADDKDESEDRDEYFEEGILITRPAEQL